MQIKVIWLKTLFILKYCWPIDIVMKLPIDDNKKGSKHN